MDYVTIGVFLIFIGLVFNFYTEISNINKSLSTTGVVLTKNLTDLQVTEQSNNMMLQNKLMTEVDTLQNSVNDKISAIQNDINTLSSKFANLSTQLKTGKLKLSSSSDDSIAWTLTVDENNNLLIGNPDPFAKIDLSTTQIVPFKQSSVGI